MEKIIIVGDNFVRRTAKSHFLRLKDSYSQRFEIDIATGDVFSSNEYITSRMTNALIEKLNVCINLPKLIVFIPENDFIQEIEYKGWGVTEYYGKYLEEIINETNKLIMEFLSELPSKSKRDGWPKVVWILPTLHKNYSPQDRELRIKFTETIENIAQHHKNVWSVKLKQVWDEDNISLYSHLNRKYTNEGYHTFWTAVDRTIKFCDRKITRLEIGNEMNLYRQNFKQINSMKFQNEAHGENNKNVTTKWGNAQNKANKTNVSSTEVKGKNSQNPDPRAYRREDFERQHRASYDYGGARRNIQF